MVTRCVKREWCDEVHSGRISTIECDTGTGVVTRCVTREWCDEVHSVRIPTIVLASPDSLSNTLVGILFVVQYPYFFPYTSV